jgi:hypothetical protein
VFTDCAPLGRIVASLDRKCLGAKDGGEAANLHTIYAWKAKYGGMDVSQAQEAKQLRDENTPVPWPTPPSPLKPEMETHGFCRLLR